MTARELLALVEDVRAACDAACDEVDRLQRALGDATRLRDRLIGYRNALRVALESWCEVPRGTPSDESEDLDV